MRLIKATDEDNEKILHFFTQSHFPGQVQIQLRRMFNFFNQYRIQSDDYVTYILQNDHEKIEAMASLVFREGVVDGQKEIIGYATDLRVARTRNAIKSWAQYFLPILETERKKRNCRYIFSVVSNSQRQAYNAFIRPRNFRRQLPRYFLFRRFKVVTLHGLWPFHSKPLAGIKIRTAQRSDIEVLGRYILKKTIERPLYFYSDFEDFLEGLNRWSDLQIENFILAFNSQNELIGCTSPWSPERVQRVYPLKYGSKAQNLKDVLQFLSWFNVAHPLPREHSELQFRYLTHLYADNPDIFYSLLHQTYQMAGKKEFLVYPQFEGELHTLPPKSFISAEMNMGLYCILSPNDKLPDFLKPRALNIPPVFEAAFL